MAHVRYEVIHQVATLVLDHPTSANALSPDMREALAEAVRRVRADPEIRALVIAGAEGKFCSGGDLRDIASAGLDAQGWRERLHRMHHWMRDLLTFDRPVIAAVDGAAYGAGFSLALTADFILASHRARFCMSFMRVGLVPDYGAFHTLPRVVGVKRAKEIMLSSREIGAAEALQLGIAMELHEPGVLLARAQALGESFVQASPSAVGLVKDTIARAQGGNLQEMLDCEANAQALAAGTAQHRKAVECFFRKEPLPFRWPERATALAFVDPGKDGATR